MKTASRCQRRHIVAAFAAMAASTPAAAAASPDDFQPFFVRAGVTFALNQSTSTLSSQNPAAMRQGNFAVFPAGVGATIGNVTTLGVEAGFYVTRNVSVDVSSGIPFFATDKTKGFNPRNPIVVNGTTLAEIMPAVVPITAVYHFDQFGALRPYVGAGVAPGFSLSNKNAFLTGVHVDPAVGFVLQGGADYMIDRHWGLSFDVKKIFSYVQAHADGMNIPGVGLVPAATFQNTRFEPWLFSAGVIYRFGAPEPVLAKY